MARTATVTGMATVIPTAMGMVTDNVKINRKDVFPTFSKEERGSHRFVEGDGDVHSHLLPGVDDGVQSADDMQAALNAMQEAGVERVFLTPHVMADLPDNRRSYLQDRFACMKQFAPEGIELRLAAEYMLDAGFRLQMADGLLDV